MLSTTLPPPLRDNSSKSGFAMCLGSFLGHIGFGTALFLAYLVVADADHTLGFLVAAIDIDRILEFLVAAVAGVYCMLVILVVADGEDSGKTLPHILRLLLPSNMWPFFPDLIFSASL